MLLKKENKSVILGVLVFLAALITRIVIIFVIETPVENDFLTLYNGAVRLNNGDLTFTGEEHFLLWPYQLGFVVWESLLLKICNSVLFLKLVNCVLASLTVLLIYLIAKEFVGNHTAAAMSIIYALLPFPAVYVTILTNQFISSFLVYSGFFVLICLKNKEWQRFLIFGILAALSNALRPEGIIPLLTVLGYLLFTLRKTNFKLKLINFLIVLVSYILVGYLLSSLVKWSGLSPDGLSNNTPYWKFVLGLNYESNGAFWGEDLAVLYDNNASLNLLKERLLMPVGQWASLLYRKIISFWNGDAIYWSFSGLTGYSVLYQALLKLNKIVMPIIYALAIFGVLSFAFDKNHDNRLWYLIFQTALTFGIYLIIEVQPRYSYHIIISISILAAVGVNYLCLLLKKKKLNFMKK